MRRRGWTAWAKTAVPFRVLRIVIPYLYNYDCFTYIVIIIRVIMMITILTICNLSG